jgi:hypothetical protein
MKRVFISVVVAGVAALGILPATSAARSAAPSATSSTTTGPALKVNPLSQHASHCAQPYYWLDDCFVILKNTKTTGVSWWMANERVTSGNLDEYSALYAGSQSGDYVSGYLAPGRSITVEIGSEDCYDGGYSYYTWLVGSSSGSTELAPQATILICF